MKLDYEGLMALAAVVRAGSFDGAAASLGVTQSAISQRIKQLEDRLGATLIIRGRPSTATEEGLLLCQHLETVSLLEEEMFGRLTGESAVGKETVTVRVCVNNDSLATWFPAVISQLSAQTRIRLEIVADDQEFTEERLRSGDALAVVTSNEKPIPGSRSVSLGHMEYMAVCTPSFFRAHFCDGVTLTGLSEAPCIIFDRKDSLPGSWVLRTYSEVPDMDKNFVPSFEGHLICCLQDIGWAMMPTMTVGPRVQSGHLRELIPGIRVAVPLYWQTRNQSSTILKTLTQFVQSIADQQMDVVANKRSISP